MRTEPQTDYEIWVITVNHEASLQYMCWWMGNAGQGKIISARGGRSTLHIFMSMESCRDIPIENKGHVVTNQYSIKSLTSFLILLLGPRPQVFYKKSRLCN